jgi:prenyltransferase beta subunit
LRSLQTREGPFLPARGADRPGLRATSSALRALKYFGGQPRDRAACVPFVKACFDKDSGGFTDQPGKGKPDVATTAVGLMAVVELKMPAGDYEGPAVAYLGKHAKDFEEVRIAVAGLEAVGKLPPQAAAWSDQLARVRNEDGTYGKGGKARTTGGAVVAELRMGKKLTEARREAVLKALRADQRDDGGFGKEGTTGSDLETTYRVMRCFHMLKDVPDAGKLRGFVARCRNDDGGYGVTPGQKSSVSGTYFAGIVLHWLDAK